MKTTKEDFKKFQEYAAKWQVKLGLIEWTIYYEHADIDGVYAKTHWSSKDMAATVQLSRSWGSLRPKTTNEIDSLALHEILHILMAPLCSEAEWRFTSQDAIEMAEHSIVRRLEHLLLKQ